MGADAMADESTRELSDCRRWRKDDVVARSATICHLSSLLLLGRALGHVGTIFGFQSLEPLALLAIQLAPGSMPGSTYYRASRASHDRIA